MVNEKRRLIDANMLMEQVKAIHKAVDTSAVNTDYDTGFHSATSQVQGLIAYMPTVDAVEVVRCKECKHLTADGLCWEKIRGSVGYKEISLDDFCSYGERKQ